MSCSCPIRVGFMWSYREEGLELNSADNLGISCLLGESQLPLESRDLGLKEENKFVRTKMRLNWPTCDWLRRIFGRVYKGGDTGECSLDDSEHFQVFWTVTQWLGPSHFWQTDAFSQRGALDASKKNGPMSKKTILPTLTVSCCTYQTASEGLTLSLANSISIDETFLVRKSIWESRSEIIFSSLGRLSLLITWACNMVNVECFMLNVYFKSYKIDCVNVPANSKGKTESRTLFLRCAMCDVQLLLAKQIPTSNSTV